MAKKWVCHPNSLEKCNLPAHLSTTNQPMTNEEHETAPLLSCIFYRSVIFSHFKDLGSFVIVKQYPLFVTAGRSY